MTTAHITFHGCVPGELGGYSSSRQAWDKLFCRTEELVWCDAHPAAHPDCATAGCRAEEVRLSLTSLEDYDGTPGYPCPELTRLQLWVDSTRRAQGKEGKACVPPGDKRSFHLPQCTESVAAARSEFHIQRRLVSARFPSQVWNLD